MAIFVSILITSSLVSTLIVLAACIASSRTQAITDAEMVFSVPVRSPEHRAVATTNSGESFANNAVFATN